VKTVGRTMLSTDSSGGLVFFTRRLMVDRLSYSFTSVCCSRRRWLGFTPRGRPRCCGPEKLIERRVIADGRGVHDPGATLSAPRRAWDWRDSKQPGGRKRSHCSFLHDVSFNEIVVGDRAS